MLEQRGAGNNVKRFTVDINQATSIERLVERPALIRTSDDVIVSACINCVNPTCINYYNDETQCPLVDNFASLNDMRVCAFDAIGFNVDGEPCINSEKCIGCGLCAARCPLGAIYQCGGRYCISHAHDSESYSVLRGANQEERQFGVIKTIRGLPATIEAEPRPFDKIAEIYERLAKCKRDNDRNLLFCRNVLIGAGFSCAISRTGLAATRMDAVYQCGEHCGAIEIEFDGDSLSSARNLLDDVATMNSRNGISVERNTPLALFSIMPNTRQDYFQVCDDIRKVLDLHILTLTVPAVLLLVWAGKTLRFGDGRFELGYGRTSIRSELEDLLNMKLDDYPIGSGYLEPIK